MTKTTNANMREIRNDVVKEYVSKVLNAQNEQAAVEILEIITENELMNKRLAVNSQGDDKIDELELSLLYYKERFRESEDKNKELTKILQYCKSEIDKLIKKMKINEFDSELQKSL